MGEERDLRFDWKNMRRDFLKDSMCEFVCEKVSKIGKIVLKLEKIENQKTNDSK